MQDFCNSGNAYARHKDRVAATQRTKSREAREISGDCPAVKNPARRARCLKSVKLFCRTYLPDVFYLPFSQDHLRVLTKAEHAVIDGGQFAMAMPRASGKTAVCMSICLWALLSGRHEFLMFIGATKKHATEMLEALQTQLETNDLLYEDFPEVCYPIRCLNGIKQRRLLWKGETIRMNFTKERLILPNLPPNPASSAIVAVAGITGRIRGIKFTRPDGREVRPSLAVCDDPQTHKSARSPGQCDQRERIINGDIMGLAGPDKPISALLPCTVIYPDDLADRILDSRPEKNPQWKGERTKFVYEWPKGEAANLLWENYSVLYRQALADDREPREAVNLYRKNRKVMDAGSRVSWPERKYPGTLSALQHAYNLRIRVGPVAFDAEYQNDPPRDNLIEGERLDTDQVAGKVNRLPRKIVPITASHLVAFIDVQENVLPYVVAGFAPDFSGSIVDYGAWPDQGQIYWTKRDAQKSYAGKLPNAGFEAQLYNALTEATEMLLGREWTRDGAGGNVCSIDLCLIDANWGLSTNIVYQFCRESKYRAILLPSHGKGVKSSDRPLNEYQQKPGDQVGENYRIPASDSRRAIRHLVFDTNYWKSFAEARFRSLPGARGSLSLFGDGPHLHRMFADHMTSEMRVKTMARGRTVDEWKPPEPGRDNDWWDGVVGCCVAAHRRGARLLDDNAPPRQAPQRPRVNMPAAPGRSSFFVTDR